MKIAVIGATGNAGTRIVGEALRRGHSVSVIARNPAIPGHQRMQSVQADVHQPAQLVPELVGSDAVVSAVMFRQAGPEVLVNSVRASGVRRYLVVGGAGSLEVMPGKLNLDQPNFPSFAKEEATRGKEFLEYLRGVEDLDWTFLSPSAVFTAGERTGRFRLGLDALLTAEDGRSWISYEDFAVAMLDEIEQPRHIRRRFTIGY